jgi:hypothetical protein
VLSKMARILLLIATMGNVGARAANIEPVEATDLPFASGYSLFWIHQGDVIDKRTPRLGITPTRFEIASDPTTKRPRFGIQFSLKDPRNKTILLNLSLKYVFNRNEVQDLMKRAQENSDIYKNGEKAQFVLLQPTRATFGFYYASKSADTTVSFVPLPNAPQGTLSLDGTLSLAASLNIVPQDAIYRALTDSDARFGVFALQTIGNPIVTSKNAERQVSSVSQLIRKQTFIDRHRRGFLIGCWVAQETL